MAPARVLDFWFVELSPKARFTRDVETDRLIKQRFGALYASAVQGEISEWRDTLHGRLAEIIVLDQFSRNLYRDDARAFQCDSMALALSQEALGQEAVNQEALGQKVLHQNSLAQPDIEELAPEKKAFLYMPFMHSESRQIHARAVVLFSQPGLEKSLDFELRHKAIIDRFGRYPHRNAALGRVSTPEEIAFLKQPDSNF